MANTSYNWCQKKEDKLKFVNVNFFWSIITVKKKIYLIYGFPFFLWDALYFIFIILYHCQNVNNMKNTYNTPSQKKPLKNNTVIATSEILTPVYVQMAHVSNVLCTSRVLRYALYPEVSAVEHTSPVFQMDMLTTH